MSSSASIFLRQTLRTTFAAPSRSTCLRASPIAAAATKRSISSRAITSIPNASTTTLRAPLYHPIPQRQFSNTGKMATDAKGGVHVLENKAAWDDALAADDSLVVLDCFATWCGPCKMISPQVVKYSNQYTNARFYKLDVDDVSDVAAELGIRAMPTFLFFKNGKKINEVVGANPKALEAAIVAGIEAKAE